MDNQAHKPLTKKDVQDVIGAIPEALQEVYPVLSAAGVAAGAYHGFKRNNSVGWAIGWALLGGLFPFITIPVSLAQGFGKKV